MSGRKVACAIRSLANAMGLQVECARVLCETLLVPEKERSRIRAVRINNLRGLLGINRM